MNQNNPSRLAFSVPEACAATSLGRSSLYAEIRSKRLPTFKIGARTLIHADDLRAWVESYREPPSSDVGS
jgi:excisionase family DNA binding protein